MSHNEPQMPQLGLFEKVLTQSLLPCWHKFLVASSVAGAAHLHLQRVSVSRLPHQDCLEHHAVVAQLLELISPMDLHEQV